MEERGTVVELRDGAAIVELAREEKCENCRCCAVLGEGRMRMEAAAPDGAAVGDRVVVEVSEERMRAIVLVFALPLAALLAGVIAGHLASRAFFGGEHTDLLSIACAAVLVTATYVGVHLHERASARRRPPPRIIRIEGKSA